MKRQFQRLAVLLGAIGLVVLLSGLNATKSQVQLSLHGLESSLEAITHLPEQIQSVVSWATGSKVVMLQSPVWLLPDLQFSPSLTHLSLQQQHQRFQHTDAEQQQQQQQRRQDGSGKNCHKEFPWIAPTVDEWFRPAWAAARRTKQSIQGFFTDVNKTTWVDGYRPAHDEITLEWDDRVGGYAVHVDEVGAGIHGYCRNAQNRCVIACLFAWLALISGFRTMSLLSDGTAQPAAQEGVYPATTAPGSGHA